MSDNNIVTVESTKAGSPPETDDNDELLSSPSSPSSPSSCPVCFETDDRSGDSSLSILHQFQRQLLYGQCGHAVCRACIERMMVQRPLPQQRQQPQPQPQPHPHQRRDEWDIIRPAEIITVPTLSLCPMCRTPWNLFDLTVDDPTTDGTQKAYETDDYTLALLGHVYACQDGGDDNNDDGIGVASFHFDPNNPNEPPQPYLNVERVLVSAENPHLALKHTLWHSNSRTLQACIDLEQGPFQQWKVVLSFAPDYSYVRAGMIHQVRRQNVDVADLHPLDGIWTTTTTTTTTNDPEEETSNHRRCTIRGSMLITQDHNVQAVKVHREAHFVERIDAASQRTIAGADWNWTEQPYGPGVGECMEWKGTNEDDIIENNSSSSSMMIWRRDTVATEVPQDEVNALGGGSGRVYRRVNMPRTFSEPPHYHAHQLMGNVFCQGFKVGRASYHFTNEEESYISYEHETTSQWPRLDNGSPIPNRVYFQNAVVAYRTFRGTIAWLDTYGTSWQRMIRWDLEMVFDTAFTCIVGGHVVATDRTGLVRELSSYQKSLAYINAALYDVYRETSLENFAPISHELRHRLHSQGTSARTTAQVHKVLTAACTGADNPIDLNLE